MTCAPRPPTLALVFLACGSLALACGDGGGGGGAASDASAPREDAGAPAADAGDFDELSAAIIAKYKDCDFYEPTKTDADYSVEDSFDACLASCLADASCDELRGVACDGSVGGAVGTCLDGCKPSLSLPGGFQCDNGRSIPHAFLCDLEADCAGGEDEENCGTFTCDSGRVLPSRSVRCDQMEDCADGSDERGCKLSC